MDIELSARLTFHEFLLEALFAIDAAGRDDGEKKLAAFSEQLTQLFVAQPVGAMTEEERLEWQVQASTIAGRFFGKCQARRADIVRMRER